MCLNRLNLHENEANVKYVNRRLPSDWNFALEMDCQTHTQTCYTEHDTKKE